MASKGILSKNAAPIPAGSLRRYLLEFRIYAVWAKERASGSEPETSLVVEELARRGVTGQYRRPLAQDDVEKFFPDFRRRHRVFSLDLNEATP
ncbi:hypothetical protein [Streptomyces sp. NPDC023838]|uniref:hypothetical protein n=1 Tax=Streptomyces sp. NPDC023838 TaxID=3154325 RepID=UPI0033CFBD25